MVLLFFDSIYSNLDCPGSGVGIEDIHTYEHWLPNPSAPCGRVWMHWMGFLCVRPI